MVKHAWGTDVKEYIRKWGMPPICGAEEPPKKTDEQLKKEAEDKAKEEAAKKGKPVTQEAIDRIFGKLKETEEKLVRSEKDKVGLVGRISDLEKRISPVAPALAGDGSLKSKFSEKNYPKTEEEWDDLIADHPTYGTDLRNTYVSSRQKGADVQDQSRKKVEQDHPDMFQRDANGNFIIDTEGVPQIDLTTKKGKIFKEIAEAGGIDADGIPHTWKALNGPTLIMTATLARLGQEDEGKVKDELKKKKEKEEKDRLAAAGNANVITGGAPPPPPPKAEVKFNSASEKQLAEDQVKAGKYKDLQEYCNTRDNKTIGYGRGGF